MSFKSFYSLEQTIKCELAFSNGYWNVFKYTTDLDQYLKDNDIDYKAIDWYEKNKT